MKFLMRISPKKLDLIILFSLILVLIGLPLGMQAYDQSLGQGKIPPGAKAFTLTGHAQRGWLPGEVRAFNVISLWGKTDRIKKPVIKVSKGDRVVFKLKSSDVVHGFSLKDLGVFLTKGIQPGKVVFVSFTADKAGTFTFSCNAICGDNHQKMQGTLIVKA